MNTRAAATPTRVLLRSGVLRSRSSTEFRAIAPLYVARKSLRRGRPVYHITRFRNHASAYSRKPLDQTRPRAYSSPACTRAIFKNRVHRIALRINCARFSRDCLFTLHASPARDKLLSTSARDLTPTVVPKWQHLQCAAFTKDCAVDTQTRNMR